MEWISETQRLLCDTQTPAPDPINALQSESLSLSPFTAIQVPKGVLNLWFMKVSEYKEQCGYFYMPIKSSCGDIMKRGSPLGIPHHSSISLSSTYMDFSSSGLPLSQPWNKVSPPWGTLPQSALSRIPYFPISAKHSTFCSWPIVSWIFWTDHLGVGHSLS